MIARLQASRARCALFCALLRETSVDNPRRNGIIYFWCDLCGFCESIRRGLDNLLAERCQTYIYHFLRLTNSRFPLQVQGVESFEVGRGQRFGGAGSSTCASTALRRDGFETRLVSVVSLSIASIFSALTKLFGSGRKRRGESRTFGTVSRVRQERARGRGH